MKLAIMQPYFFPYIGYFQAISEVDKYILYGNVTFIKKGRLNRNQIVLKNGDILQILVPLIHKSSNVLISNVQIDNHQEWKKKILKTIYMNYKGSVSFDEVFQLLEDILRTEYNFLFDLNSQSIISIARFLDIQTEIACDNTKYFNLEKSLISSELGTFDVLQDLMEIHPITKVARILQMCKIENSNIYINAIGGQNLYYKEEFAQYGINLKFLKSNEFTYRQFNNKFISKLSIIDVLMHNGKEGTKKLLKEYTLI